MGRSKFIIRNKLLRLDFRRSLSGPPRVGSVRERNPSLSRLDYEQVKKFNPIRLLKKREGNWGELTFVNFGSKRKCWSGANAKPEIIGTVTTDRKKLAGASPTAAIPETIK